MKTLQKGNTIFILILLAYCVYAGLYILRTSFVIDGQRYFSLFDDAMISMRYAKNLAHGYGLVWNPGGERVEGYTNLLWVLYMAAFHLFFVAASKVSVLIQITGALFLLMNLVVVKKTADFISGNSTWISLAAVSFTAFYLPLNTWGLQGTEVSVLTLIMSICIWQLLRCLQSGTLSAWPYLLLGIATLLRIDMFVPSLALLLFVSAADPANRRKHLMFGIPTLMAFVLGQTVFRLSYYGSILPNTYYLKMVGYPFLLRISRGIYVSLLFIYRMNPVLFLLPFAVLLFRRDKYILFLFWIFWTQIAYSVYVGGDAWESWGGANRFVSIVMPVFFILFSYSLAQITTSVIARVPRKTALQGRSAKVGVVVLLLISLLNFNAVHGTAALPEWLLLNRPLNVQANGKYVATGLLLTRITNPQAKVAVVWAGATPYFSDRYSIDLLGKNDAKIAREPMRTEMFSGLEKLTAFYPGHLKWDLDYSIGELKPDVVVEWGGWMEDITPYIQTDYQLVKLREAGLFLRRGSPNILWDQIEAGRR